MDRFKETYSLLGKSSLFRLVFFSLVYLLLPNLIFVIGWFRWEVAFPSVVVLILSFHFVLLSFKHQKYEQVIGLSCQLNLLVIGVAILVCVVSGVGGLIFQGDQDKHYGVLIDLISKPWPVIYKENYLVSNAAHLNYYLGYYLPVGFLSKFTGTHTADLLIFLWTLLGVYLVLRWVLVWKSKNLPIIAIVIFLFFGGQEFLYVVIKHVAKWAFLGEAIQGYIFKMEIATEGVVHNNMLQFYSPMMSMTWCPQHVLGGWLATAMIFHQFTIAKNLRSSVFIMSLTFIWSIFNSIGLTLLLLILFFKKGFAPFISFQNILGVGVLTVLVGFYFEAHYSINEKYWIWEAIPDKSWLPKVVVFLLIEFGIYAWFSYRFVKSKSWKLIWWGSIIVLLIIPFYVVGYFNDFLMRAAVPSLFIISIVFIQFFSDLHIKHKYRWFIILLLLANIPYFTLKYRLYIKGLVDEQTSVANSISVSKVRKEKWFNTQYLGSNKSIYWLYLASDKNTDVNEKKAAIESKKTKEWP